MNKLNAKPQILKQANLSLIRKIIKNKGTATRAEIAYESQISSTTVRSLLIEMLENKELESIGCDESSGGRKAERYRFKIDRYYGAAFCIDVSNSSFEWLLVNICGEIIEKGKVSAEANEIEELIIKILDKLTAEKEIRAVGLGVSGIVTGSSYLFQDEKREIQKSDIGEEIARKYKIPVILENDLNAIAIGYAHSKNIKNPSHANDNIAFIYFTEDFVTEGCVSAGFISDGRIIRGFNNYAGEIGLFPTDGVISSDSKTFSETLSGEISDEDYCNLVIKILCWICVILNPAYIVLGGLHFRKECFAEIADRLHSVLPKDLSAEILYSTDTNRNFIEGMAFLTAGKIFDDIQFVSD